MSQISWKFT